MWPIVLSEADVLFRCWCWQRSESVWDDWRWTAAVGHERKCQIFSQWPSPSANVRRLV